MKKKEKSGDTQFKEDMDRIEAAFRKFDIDNDGFIDWEEFKKVSKNLNTEQARRIFDSCDQVTIWDIFTDMNWDGLLKILDKPTDRQPKRHNEAPCQS